MQYFAAVVLSLLHGFCKQSFKFMRVNVQKCKIETDKIILILGQALSQHQQNQAKP